MPRVPLCTHEHVCSTVAYFSNYARTCSTYMYEAYFADRQFKNTFLEHWRQIKHTRCIRRAIQSAIQSIPDFNSSSTPNMSVVGNFPEVLYEMLINAEKEGHESIISFFSHGRAFAVHDTNRFVKELMPRYFLNMGKIASFQRQLNLYGFKRISDGPDNGGYWHRKFLNGRRDLVIYLKRKSTSKAKRLLQEAKEAEEESKDMIDPLEFYVMPSIPPSSYTTVTVAQDALSNENEDSKPTANNAALDLEQPRRNHNLEAQSLLELRGRPNSYNRTSEEFIVESNIPAPSRRQNGGLPLVNVVSHNHGASLQTVVSMGRAPVYRQELHNPHMAFSNVPQSVATVVDYNDLQLLNQIRADRLQQHQPYQLEERVVISTNQPTLQSQQLVHAQPSSLNWPQYASRPYPIAPIRVILSGGASQQ